MKPCSLSNALTALLPGAVIIRRREHGWRSATFSGIRLVLDLQIAGSDAVLAKNFATMVEDHEFSLPDLLVADIAVTEQRNIGSATALTVEALLLDEES
jgi:hypothetical protein